MNEILAFEAVFLACLARTTMPYWYKKKADGTLKFERKYLGTLVGALISSFVVASFIYPTIQLPDQAVSNVLGFVTVFTSAWGVTDLWNKLAIDAWREQ